MNSSMTRLSIINPWLPYLRPDSRASLRLFCFPYAGGNAVNFRAWADKLPSVIDVCPVELPGRGRRMTEPRYTNLLELVQTLLTTLRPYLDVPFAFFGHSMGATIAFELSRRLRGCHDLQPSHLFVSGRRAPHVPYKSRPTYDLPDAELLQELQQLNGTPKEVLENHELMQLMLPLLRADFEMVQTYAYSPGPMLNSSITAFGGLEDTEERREGLEAWRYHTSGNFTLHMIAGNHFFLNMSQAVLLRLLAQELDQLLV